MKKDSEDIELLIAMKQGDREALSSLYLQYHTFLLHYGLRIVANKLIVEDCIQEMFVDIFESRESLGDIRNVKAYLFSVIRRRVLKKIKTKRKLEEVKLELTEMTSIHFSTQDVSHENEDQDIKNQAILQALNDLSWRQREAIYLRYFNNLNTREIAEIMQVSNQTVLNTIYQGLSKVRKFFIPTIT